MQPYFTRPENSYKRGDIYYINNNRGQRGNEIKKDRPAVIVSADFLNKYSGDVVVVFLTSQPKKDLSTHVTIRTTGRISTALCEQPTTISVERINNRIGSVTDREMQEISTALLTSLQLDFEQRKPEAKKQSGGDLRDSVIKLETERDTYKNLCEKMINCRR
mgnify:CR=1 FL=1